LTGASHAVGNRALLGWLTASQEKRVSDFAGAAGSSAPGLVVSEEKG